MSSASTPDPTNPTPPGGPDGDTAEVFFQRYRQVRELGRGGMGLVILAHDILLDVPVALKLVPEVVVRDSEGISDLKKEVLRGMALTHPNIVRVFSFEQDARHAAIVMEHVPGETLAQKKADRDDHCFDCDEILRWIEQLCSALDYAHHDACIAHRDLKPSNLLVSDQGRLKVADFGIASSLSETLTRISVRRDTAGTPPYMSPQQAMGERPTHLDDIYSLGATIYELLTGKPPFFRGNVLAQVIQEEAPSMAARRTELGVTKRQPIPETWEKTVAACLAKTPFDRPASGASVLAMLKGAPVPPRVEPASKPAPAPTLPAPPVQTVSRPAVPAGVPETETAAILPHVRLGPRPGVFSRLAKDAGELLGTALRPVVILALAAAVAWGAYVLKQRWDAQHKTGEPRMASPAEKPASAPKPTPAPTRASALDKGHPRDMATPTLQTGKLNP